MRDPITPHGVNTGIPEGNLDFASRSGVMITGGLQVISKNSYELVEPYTHLGSSRCVDADHRAFAQLCHYTALTPRKVQKGAKG